MHTLLNSEVSHEIDASHSMPCVSIMLPFEPKMTSKSAITLLLNKAADKVERMLIENYSPEFGKIVMNKLRIIYNDLNFGSHKKSIAIYVSPILEKVFYLNFSLKVNVSVGDDFTIRDIVLSKEQNTDYIIMLLGDDVCNVYSGNDSFFKRFIHDNWNFVNPNPSFKSPTFLHHIDIALKRILRSYPVPLFVVGTKKILTNFKNITVNNLSVNQFISGDYEAFSNEKLQHILKPFVKNWVIVKKQFLLNKMRIAAQTNDLIFGIGNVWAQAMQRNGQLLLVQENYMYVSEQGNSEDIINNITQPYNKFSYTKDLVEDAIEKVLENGGDVEFVDGEFLKDLGPIALIK